MGLCLFINGFAKEYWVYKVDLSHPSNPIIFGEYWPLRIEGHKVLGYALDAIYAFIHSGEIAQCWLWKERLFPKSFHIINWPACQKSLEEMGLIH